jgi:ribokinase
LASLAESGVNSEFVQRDSSLKTASCCIHVDQQGNNAIIIVPQANMACSAEDVAAAAKVVRSADIVLCQLEIPLPTVAYALALAQENRVPAILNPAPAQHVPASLLSHVTLLTPNETEAEILSGIAIPTERGVAEDSWAKDVANNLLKFGPQTILITLGERGAYVARPSGHRLIPSYPVAVVDTTAAGDAFNGALAVALGEGKELEDAVAFANAAGALATTRAGAQPSLAARQDIEVLYRG